MLVASQGWCNPAAKNLTVLAVRALLCHVPLHAYSQPASGDGSKNMDQLQDDVQADTPTAAFLTPSDHRGNTTIHEATCSPALQGAVTRSEQSKDAALPCTLLVMSAERPATYAAPKMWGSGGQNPYTGSGPSGGLQGCKSHGGHQHTRHLLFLAGAAAAAAQHTMPQHTMTAMGAK